MRKELSVVHDPACEPAGYRPTGYGALHDQQAVVLRGHGLQKIRGFKPNEGWCFCDPITNEVTSKVEQVPASDIEALPYYFIAIREASV